MARAVLAVCAAALMCAGSSAAARADSPTVQDVVIPGAGGVQLACVFALPAGTPPVGGWPGLVIFPGLNNPPAELGFLTAGFASVECDERGTGGSNGTFDLAGPMDAQDAQAIFDWFVARPEVSDTEIGAEGEDLGGAEVWNAAVAGVPFKAIAPVDTWSSLARALRSSGVLNTKLFQLLAAEGSTAWNTASGIAARSYRGHLHTLTVPAFIVQRRQDFRVDLSQATSAYGLLAAKKRLFIGASKNQVIVWFLQQLAGGAPVGGGVWLQHAAPDSLATHYSGLPPASAVNVNLPGAALKRSVWLTGGPHETFGGGSVTIRYSGASWGQVVATVSTATGTVVTEGAARVKSDTGVLTIPLLNEVAVLPRGKKLVVTLSSHDSTFGGSATGEIAIQRVTLRLSVLERAVSR